MEELRKKLNPPLASIAQLVERRTFNPCVAGSSPAGGTIMLHSTRRKNEKSITHTTGKRCSC
jgi:hypothetical protein